MEGHPAEVDVYEKPFIFYQLALLKKHNVNSVLVATQRFGKETLEFISRNLGRYTVEYEWIEGPFTPADLKALAHRLDDVFFITRHDRFLPVDYYLIWRWFTMNPVRMLGTIVVRRPTERYPANLLGDLGAKRVHSYEGERRNLLDYGVRVLRKEAIALASGQDRLAGLYNRLAEDGHLGAFLTDKNFFDATPEGLKGLRRYLLYSRL